MRLSEKSVELNFCAEATAAAGLAAHPFWCGLTQQQEKKLGFDVAGMRGGRLLIYQFKASNQFAANGLRRFRAPHHQLVNLRKLATGPDQVFYVFPEIGTSSELVAAGSITSKAWLCDVWFPTLKALGPSHRKGGEHYVDLDPATKQCTWHSDVAEVPVVTALEWFSRIGRGDGNLQAGSPGSRLGSDIGIPLDGRAGAVFRQLRELNSRKLLGLLIR